jgi:hypothetical protein
MEYAESEHLFFGLRQDEGPFFGDPLLVPREVVNGHVYIAGQTGSGKTALGIIPLITQLAMPYYAPLRDAGGAILRDGFGRVRFKAEPEPRPAFLNIDLKGDPAYFNTCRVLAEKHGYPFRFFSIDRRHSSHYFNPFRNLQPRAPIELCEILMQALSLFHGEDYGASFFTRQHRRLLLTVLDDAEKAQTKIESWRQLYLSASQLKGRLFRDATELLSVLHAMTFYPQMEGLREPPQGTTSIHMHTVLEEGQMVYFWLPSGAASLSVREIAKLAVYSLFTAARERAEQGKKRQAYVFIDEFHRVAGENMDPMLTLSRAFGLSFILSNQDPKALELRNFDLKATVYANTRLKQFFTLTDSDENRRLVALSGEKRVERETVTASRQLDAWGFLRGTSESRALREERAPRLDEDTLRLITDDADSSLVWVARGAGLCDLKGVPVWVKGLWPMSFEEYARRSDFSKVPWPRVEEAPTSIPPADVEKSRDRADALYEQNVKAMEDLLSDKAGDRSAKKQPKRKSRPTDERRREKRARTKRNDKP